MVYNPDRNQAGRHINVISRTSIHMMRMAKLGNANGHELDHVPERKDLLNRLYKLK